MAASRRKTEPEAELVARGRKGHRLPRILQLVRAGVPITDAAEACGIHRSTIYEWASAQPDVADALKAAEGAFVALHVGLVSQAARGGTWQASAWLLERRRPMDFALRVDRFESADLGVGAVEVTLTLGELEDGRPRRLAASQTIVVDAAATTAPPDVALKLDADEPADAATQARDPAQRNAAYEAVLEDVQRDIEDGTLYADRLAEDEPESERTKPRYRWMAQKPPDHEGWRTRAPRYL